MNQKKKVSAREMRRVLGAAAPTIQQLAHNDKISQQRIVAAEARLDQAEAFRALSFGQRLRWFFRGEQ